MSEKIEVLLTLSLPPSFEEPLVDWLLENEPDLGFASTPSYGHGFRPERLSLFEQVAGKQRRVALQIVTSATRAQLLFARLASVLADTEPPTEAHPNCSQDGCRHGSRKRARRTIDNDCHYLELVLEAC